jgi:hypothetical protein
VADFLVALGTSVVKTACKIWFNDRQFAADTSGTVADLVSAKAAEARERRHARQFDNVAISIADRLQTVLDQEFRGLSAHEANAALLAVADTFDHARLVDADLFESDLDPLYLERHLRSGAPRATRDLSAVAEALYNRVLPECCAYVIEVTTALPRFGAGAFAEILRRETQLIEDIRALLDRVPAPSQTANSFAAVYRRQVAIMLDRLELFGIGLSDSTRQYGLSVAYLSLDVRTDAVSPGVTDPWITDKGVTQADSIVRIEQALASAPLLFIRGEAGSGKTTLLQWLAVRSARQDFNADLAAWNDTMPFFIPLRRYAGQELPAPEDFLHQVGRHIADEMPHGWVHRLLREGRALVLIDGVDEVPERHRVITRRWLGELVATYPEARYIVTSRPAAVSDTWLARERFATAELRPLAWPDIKEFVGHWHAAMRNETADQAAQERISSYEARLLGALQRRRHLRSLATSPLLCALLCALHLERHTQLPDDRMELYEVALEMLLERRDSERLVTGDLTLSRTEKSLLLQELAYWLIRNGWSDASLSQAADQIGHRLQTMPRLSGSDPAIVLQHLLERSGLIRKPVEDRIDFVHRTFQEFLAAEAATDADDIGLLIDNATSDQWREVIVMAAGHAQRRQRTQLLQALLDHADLGTWEGRANAILAVACMETAPELDQDIHQQLRDLAEKLLPPRLMGDADRLARVGDFVLDLLAEQKITSARAAAATIRTAAGVGGPSALQVIAMAANVENSQVLTELMAAWPKFDADEFALEVLAESPNSDWLYLRKSWQVRVAHRLRRTISLTYSCRLGLGDVGFVRELPQLQHLNIIEDPVFVDLSPLTGHPALDTLYLGRTGRVDLSPLPAVPHLSNDLFVDLRYAFNPEAIRECGRLRHVRLATLPFVSLLTDILPPQLHTLGCYEWADLTSLHQLNGLSQLSELTVLMLINNPSLDSLDGIEQWASTLNTLYAVGLQTALEADLAKLPNLTFLYLEDLPRIDLNAIDHLPRLEHVLIRRAGKPELAPLGRLTQLRSLIIDEVGDVDLSPLAGLQGLTVKVPRRTRVVGKEFLGPRSKIVRTTY